MTDTNKCKLLSDHEFRWDINFEFVVCTKCAIKLGEIVGGGKIKKPRIHIQANLRPETLERCAKVTGMTITRPLDKLINAALDKVEEARNTSEEM